MKVTVLADASFHPDHNVGGYGFWIASERGKLPGGGPFKRHVSDNNSAEMMAIVNALYEGAQAGLIQEGDFVLIQTDSQYAIDRFWGRKRLDTADAKLAHEKFHHLKRVLRMRYDFRHVKGHSRSNDARFVANNMCDKRAKLGMQTALQFFLLNKELKYAPEASVHPS